MIASAGVAKPTKSGAFAAEIRRAIATLKRGGLCFFGSWFGRPYDNEHVAVEAEAEGDCLMVRFNEGEVLRVWEPEGCVWDAKHFRIERAAKVRWEWFYYGRRHADENLRFEEFIPKEDRVEVKTNWEGGFHPNPGVRREAPAVEMDPLN